MSRLKDVEAVSYGDLSQEEAGDLLQQIEQPALLETSEVSGELPETSEQADANIMVKLKAVAKMLDGWKVGPLIRSTFTRAQSMELRGPSGDVYIIRIPLDFAAALMNEEDVRQVDSEIRTMNDGYLFAEYKKKYGRIPSIDELEIIRDSFAESGNF